MSIDKTRVNSVLVCLGKIFFFMLMLVSGFSVADEMRPSVVKLTKLDDQSWSVAFRQPQINGRYPNLRLKTNCTAGEITPFVNGAALQENFQLICDSDGLRTIEIEGLEKTLVDTMVTIRGSDGEEESHLISSSRPVLNVGESVPAVPVYIVLGVEHLIFGIDHVLFVLVLLYVVHGWKNLFKVITSFTVAHSVTLGLSSLELLTLAQAPVEALIGLSIVFLAAEALRGNKGYMTRAPWVVSALFGLLHGLGFAGALAEIGLPQDSVIVALLFFNIGIEVGQLLVVIVALGLVAVFGRLAGTKPSGVADSQVLTNIVRMPLYGAGTIAGYWFVERTLAIFI
ncbi:HupE/UreJ family protein [Pseudomonadales bacterium]|nr:HupE/UreJ family protein [Pseudomonadales bacterium]